MTTNNGTIKEVLFELLRNELKKIDSGHEAPWILDWISKRNPKTLEDCLLIVKEVLERRKASEPLAYIFGEWSFRDLELNVGPGVLIPRPETEELVDLVLDTVSGARNQPETLNIVDLGAGSGAIGIALAHDLQQKLPDCFFDVTLVEKSNEARIYLEKNLKKYSPYVHTKIGVFPGSWNDWAAGEDSASIDLLVSNPPYIPQSEWVILDRGVRDFEPAEALKPGSTESDPKALSCYEEILTVAAKVLKSGALGFFEMGTQATEVQELIRQNPVFKKPEIHFDIAGKKRFISFIKV